MVQFPILLNDKQVGKTFRYNLEEAAALGASIMKLAAGKNFQSKGISTPVPYLRETRLRRCKRQTAQAGRQIRTA